MEEVVKLSSNALDFTRQTLESIQRDYLREHPVSGIEVRDRYHSPFREELESKYTEQDWKIYDCVVTYYRPCERREAYRQARAWKRIVLNE